MNATERIRWLFQHGRHAEVVRTADTDPDLLSSATGEVLEYLAVSYASVKRFGRSERLFRRRIAEEPENPRHLMNMGVAMLEGGRADLALPLLTEASRRTPGDETALLNLGLAQAFMGQPSLAAITLDAVVREHPHNDVARIYLASTLIEVGCSSQAADIVRALILPGELPPQALHECGRVMSKLGEDRRAELALESAIALDPDLVQARVDLAAVLLRLGRTEAAQARLDEVPEEHQTPQYHEARTKLRQLLSAESR